jgi:tetratricopeptide (TPR) repeat protein
MGRVRRERPQALWIAGALALALFLGSEPAWGDYRDDFANGVIALERGDFQEAIRLLTAAVKENSRESTQTVKLYGMRYTEYAPHFFLGIAYSKSGDCVSAIQELQESARQGIAQGKDPTQSKWGTIKDNLQQCITIGAKAPAAKPRRTEPEPAVAQNPPPRPTETAVVLASAPVAPTRSPFPSVPTPEIVARAAAAPAAAPPPTRAPSPRPTIPSRPPDALLAAATSYFRGDYAAAVKALASARYADARTNAQALLFRSAANYGLFVLGGSRDKALEERAGRDARESSRLDPNLRVSQRAFSPRFLDFYARNRA